jgi:hypothetical protein
MPFVCHLVWSVKCDLYSRSALQGDLTKAIAAEWKALPDKDKKKVSVAKRGVLGLCSGSVFIDLPQFLDLAAKDKERYEKEKADYKPAK